ncbi:MAG: DUF4389 domain-containing protein [Actinobacteria bacterium]|nr:DUF4389 domain-containing protein [Actinomycetota bacterium]
MTYPVTYEIDSPLEIARWRPLVQWIMAIPHFFAAYFVAIVAQVVAVIAWFAIVFTGKMPEGMANILAMSLRYSARVSAYAGFLYSDYPPFTFDAQTEDPGGSPVVTSFEAALTDRNRLTVFFRLIMAIPIMIFTGIIFFVAELAYIGAFFAILFTGKWPQGIRDFVVKAFRLSQRTNAYVMLLTDEYPPFSLE